MDDELKKAFINHALREQRQLNRQLSPHGRSSDLQRNAVELASQRLIAPDTEGSFRQSDPFGFYWVWIAGLCLAYGVACLIGQAL